eukprot:496142_1
MAKEDEKQKDVEYCRVFDLGGSGLKTCIVKHVNDTIVMVSKAKNIGQCPSNWSVCDYVKSEIKSIDKEIKEGWSFSFCLCKMDKLWDDYKDRSKEYKNMRQMFGLQNAKKSGKSSRWCDSFNWKFGNNAQSNHWSHFEHCNWHWCRSGDDK